MKAIVVALALVVCGCAGPRPQVPSAAEVTVPEEWLHADEGASPPAADLWVASFGDKTLSSLVRRALDRNVDIAIAATRVAQARAQLGFADAQRKADLSVGLQGFRERDLNPGFGVAEEQTAGELAFSASYEVDLFGRLAAGSAAARASLLASDAARDTIRLAVIAAVTSGYINLQGLHARQDILVRTLATRSNELIFAKRRAEVGYAPVIDFHQAEAAFRSTEQLIPANTLAINRQVTALLLLVGDTPGAIGLGTPLNALSLPPAPAVLPAKLLRQRPDLRQAEQQLVAADRSLDAARAAFMPHISLTASGGVVDSTLIADPVQLFSLGGSVLAPLLDGGRLRAQQGVAAGKRDEAAFAYRKAALGAFKDVEDALEASDRDQETERAVEMQRVALDAVLILAKNRYRAGYSSYLEQLDAQRALLGAELAAVQARVDRLVAAVALYQSLGGGDGLTN